LKILFAHTASRWAYSTHLEETLKKDHSLATVDLLRTAYFTDIRGLLPFYVPKGIPLSYKSMAGGAERPFDLVLECSGAGQHHLAGLKRCPVPALHWTVDDHEPAKRRFEMSIKKDFDKVFVCHKDYLSFYRDVPCRWLPPACDPALHRKMDLPKLYDVGFVGNLDRRFYPERVDALERLSKRFNVRAFHKVYGDDMVKILNQSRIVFHKSFNRDLSTRVFDTLASGSFLLADRIQDGLSDCFQEGKHLALYDGHGDLEEKIAYYLAHEEEREKIAAEGRREALAKHTFAQRARAILEEAAKISK